MQKLTVNKLGAASVIVDIVQKGNPEIRPGYSLNPTEITVHNTGNSGRGANAKAHNTYIHNQSKLPVAKTGYASWHFSVDDKFIYQHLPLNETAWHTGDGSGATSGNRTSIGIEICENVDMDNYAQAEENAIALIVHLMDKLNINIQKIKPHQAYSGKFCPRVILKRDGGFTKFSKRIQDAVAKSKVTATKGELLAMKMIDVEGVTPGMLQTIGMVYKEAREDDFLSSDKWEKKATNHTITVGEAIYIATLLDQRRYAKLAKK